MARKTPVKTPAPAAETTPVANGPGPAPSPADYLEANEIAVRALRKFRWALSALPTMKIAPAFVALLTQIEASTNGAEEWVTRRIARDEANKPPAPPEPEPEPEP